jgi:hypothetical protein
MHCRLLVANQNMLDLILLEQRVINVKDRPARIAEYVFDLFFLQAPDYNLRTGHHCHHRRPSKQIARKKWNCRNVKALDHNWSRHSQRAGSRRLRIQAISNPNNKQGFRSGQPTRTVRFSHRNRTPCFQAGDVRRA